MLFLQKILTQQVINFSKYIKEGGVTLVTGASSGIGKEYAMQLAKSGSDLLIVSNQEEELKRLSELIEQQYHVKVWWKYQDLSTDDAAMQLFQFCETQRLRVDILINNAGMFFFKELQGATIEKAELMLRLHIFTPTRMCEIFGNEMKKRGYGYILNMSSMAANLTLPGITVYSATKSYLKSFTKSLYYEMLPYGVHVTVICPGAVATPLYNLSPKLDKYMQWAVKIRFVFSTELLVRKALTALFKKKRSRTPGMMNSVYPLIVNLIPKCIVNKLWVKFRS